MASVTLAAVVDLSKIKMKWHETYVSEGLNHKTAAALPKGVYSGLRMIQNIASPRQVEIAATPDSAHSAVYQSATGFSLTYFDVSGASTILNLSSASLDNQETIIALSITYTIGADTTANWIAYPIADWNALTTQQQGELIVIGTINVPAAATNITTSMIKMNRRSMAWENAAPQAAIWSPVLRNGGFEYAEDNGTFAHASSHWVASQQANLSWAVQTTSPHSGIRAMTVSAGATGLQSGTLTQLIGSPVTPGQLIKFQFFVEALKIPTSGTFTFFLKFVDSTFSTNISLAQAIPMTGVDSSYREISGVMVVPTGAAILAHAFFSYALNQGSTGVAARIDDVQVWVEAGSSTKAPGTEQREIQYLSGQTLVIEDESDPLFTDFFGNAALLHMSVNELFLERRDQNYTTSSPVELALRTARLTKLGSDLVNTNARAILPRVSAPVAVVGLSSLTLLWESGRSGETVGTYTKGVNRWYAGADGRMIHTVNALFDSGTLTWSKDVVGASAVKMTLQSGHFTLEQRLAATGGTWADGAWSSVSFDVDTEAAIMTMATDFSLKVQGTGKYKHGTQTLQIHNSYFQTTTIAISQLISQIQSAPLSVIAPIVLPVGRRILEIRVFVKDSATGPTRLQATFGTANSTGTSNSVATSGISSGAGSAQTLSVTGLTTIVAASTTYWLAVASTSGSATNILYGAEVDYDLP